MISLLQAMAADIPAPKMNGTSVGMDISEDGTGASSVSHSDSDKASIAQVLYNRVFPSCFVFVEWYSARSWDDPFSEGSRFRTVWGNLSSVWQANPISSFMLGSESTAACCESQKD